MAFFNPYDEEQYAPFGDVRTNMMYPPADPQPGGGGGGGGTPPPPGGGFVPIGEFQPPPGPGGGGVGGGGEMGGGGMGGGFAGRPQYNFGPVPQFDPGARPGNFVAPSFADAQNEPGYRFRLQSGADALERSASARGTLRTGGTLKDITSWGQNFGAQEYQNVYGRARSTYDANLAGYDRGYQGLKDTYAPKLAQWQFLSESERAAALAQYQQAWERFQFNHLSAAQKEALKKGGGGGDPGEPFNDLPPPDDE